MRRTRQVGRIARGLVEVVCGYPCVRLPMPMSQNMRKRACAVRLIQSRRGRDRKRSPAWGAAHRCRVPRHRQSALILAPARSPAGRPSAGKGRAAAWLCMSPAGAALVQRGASHLAQLGRCLTVAVAVLAAVLLHHHRYSCHRRHCCCCRESDTWELNCPWQARDASC